MPLQTSLSIPHHLLPLCSALGRWLASHADPFFSTFIILVLAGSLRISLPAQFPKHNSAVSVCCHPGWHPGTGYDMCSINISQFTERRWCLHPLRPQVLVLHAPTTPPLPPCLCSSLPRPCSSGLGPSQGLTNRALPCLHDQLLIKRAFN